MFKEVKWMLPTDRLREGKSWSTAVYPLVNPSSSLGQFHSHTDSHGQAQRDTNNAKGHEGRKEMTRKRKGRQGRIGVRASRRHCTHVSNQQRTD